MQFAFNNVIRLLEDLLFVSQNGVDKPYFTFYVRVQQLIMELFI